MKVISIKNLDVNNIELCGVSYTPARKTIQIRMKDPETKSYTFPLMLQLPVVETPFGLNYFKDQPNKVYLDISIQSEQTIKKFMEIDEYIKQLATLYNEKWFDDTSKNIEYSHSIYQRNSQTDRVYPPTFRLKFVGETPYHKEPQSQDENYITSVYDRNLKEIDSGSMWNAIPKQTRVVPIVHCVGIWIIRDRVTHDYKYGLEWKLCQIKIL